MVHTSTRRGSRWVWSAPDKLVNGEKEGIPCLYDRQAWIMTCDVRLGANGSAHVQSSLLEFGTHSFPVTHDQPAYLEDTAVQTV